MGQVSTSTTPTPGLLNFGGGGGTVLLGQSLLNTYPAHVVNLYSQLAGGFRTSRPLAVLAVTSGSAVAVPNTTDSVVAFGSAVRDNDGMFSTVAPTQVSIQTSGWYRCSLQVRWPVNGTGYRACKILFNGLVPAAAAIGADFRQAGSSGEGDVTACEGVAHLTAGSSVFANVWQSSGGSLTYQTAGSGTRLTVEWIAP